MTSPVLLDLTRAVMRRLRGHGPSGIDRVCDAYAAHYATDALAVLQFRGHPVVLDRPASERLFHALGAAGNRLRREVILDLLRAPFAAGRSRNFAGALYINVGHTGFDRPAHWRWIRAHGLNPAYMLHDLIPLTHPQVTTPHKTRRHRGRVTAALAGAAGIIANSKATALELQRFAGRHDTDLPPIIAAPIGGGALPTPLRRQPEEPPIFLAVGTIERRKNLVLLLDVWQRLCHLAPPRMPRLVIAGNDGLGSAEFHRALRSRHAIAPFVTVRHGLGDTALGQLVASARTVLMPTLAEGFGLPLVEALEARIPVIASDLPSLRETGQAIPAFLAPYAVEAWTRMVLDHVGHGSDWQRQQALLDSYHAPNWRDHFAAVEPWLAGLRTTGAGEGFAPVEKRLYRQPTRIGDLQTRRGRDG